MLLVGAFSLAFLMARLSQSLFSPKQTRARRKRIGPSSDYY